MAAAGAEVILPRGLNMSQGMDIVKGAQKFDGIEAIQEDGSIVLTERAYSVMKEMIGYDCRKFSPEESEDRAKELLSRFKEYRKKL